ncbi:peptide ABC transporter substrate-binding protein [Sedimentimonas flavescens]|uniref:Peptide ABC transporter substrate-binding protein n=1 Tax=Sedimentimonas flavescens TaxID=2851012 RepID=A0ABT2ZWL9_9RHOB|nr:peptide ABC transporter substrate-binding protein [Sedimentimonas flavescens]MBW0159623.1 peptide ABC transporter substrate-binding protein [Sedimentimonas flavescens]MCT2540116.1 peptide ABC transporter substrate-binding protein [Sedimentimonas flavescens]MCV2878144.1 peptide ABC transporter substrate-binding protein [Sedimentimonas flavescens]WBL33901.1 peptide ABC transporter substrate-binding protein [Sinirhodobacter sp. HNIBRBA609]
MKLKTILMGAAATLALAPAAFAERGSDGQVNVIYWQAPSTLNPYLSSGTKDVEASSLVLEPFAGFNETGVVIPRLVTEVPSLENGGISEDLKTITWHITPGILWSDGTPLTAADAVFTYEYCTHPEGGCAQEARYEGIEMVEAVDDLTVKITYKEPRPNPFTAFTGATSPILQKAQFANCLGAAASSCTDQNFMPIGTGPFQVTEFKTNDVIQMVANPNYRDPAKPAFSNLTLKGGGDAAAAGRSVLETGEFDYAWNLQLAPDVLAGMEAAGKGKLVVGFGTLVERIEMNMTDPSPELAEGERSTAKHPHPFLSDIRVRTALSKAIDREILVEIGYGQAGRPTCNLVPAPAMFASDNTGCLTQDVDGAKALLDEAGWTDSDGDGIRDKDGKKLSVLYQTSTNAVRQDFQSIIKQWWNDIGVEVELKNIDGSVYFGGDAGSPDTFQKFYADVEMYANNFDGTDPEPYLAQYTCEKAPKPENQWQGENINRFCSEEYDALIVELGKTGDIEKRAELAKKLNDMLTKDSMVVVPLVDRGRVSAHSNTLGGVVLNTWDSELWNASDWYRMK